MMPGGSVVISASMLDSNKRASVELLVAQPLIELQLLRFDLLARGIVGADQQIADDSRPEHRAAP